ncbi:MAG: putative acetyltransferase [Syntrophus sp. PtaU1.Bin005]|jgi:ribosomal protein S18 acetylase RimI-like enzyme|uniref:GNAT family N-acetyltransferase n=1 Tax=Syntrophus TaxID=43773 RepID=UPI0009CE5788|nr:MAG: putative acetyltransferase [Syntrophus sp. PtaB.Bin138]OPY83664.1 MAG: putative acetyltransferase [Syntrophus sp. PtaU1.Bin005]
MAEVGEVVIRELEEKDLKAIIEIDRKLLGQSRPEYWQLKVELSEQASPLASLVADNGGRVVGFVLGNASGWEFGIPDTVGWIDTLGVDPAYHHQGIGRLLLFEMIGNMKKVGVEKIYTLVSWRSGNLLEFFDKLGFQRGDMINLELDIRGRSM